MKRRRKFNFLKDLLIAVRTYDRALSEAEIQVMQVATLGLDPKLASEVRKRLLKLWFSDETDASSNFGDEVREQLVLVCLQGDPQMPKQYSTRL